MLRARVLFAHIVLLSCTVLGAFALISGAVLQPMIASINEERAALVVYLIDQAEGTGNPERRLGVLTRRVHLQAQVLDALPERGQRRLRRARRLQIEGHEVYVFPGPNTPIVAPLLVNETQRWVVVKFPVDLEKPPRHVGLGLLVLVAVAMAAAWMMTRWVLRPLELAGDGMERMAAGELGHRLPSNPDITGRIGDTFNQMADRIESLVEGQRQMMAAVSHEVRTPLARLRLHTELLRDEGARADRTDLMEESIEEIDALIEELLESARLEQGALALRMGVVSVEQLLTQGLAQVSLGERPVSLHVAPKLVLMADDARLLRVVRNLLSNIARYTPADCPVELSAHKDGEGWVVLRVSDRGPGVSEAALQKLFDPFFRAESSRSKATGGLGLGLMLVRQIVRAHGGSIEACNRAGGGLEIAIKLPSAPQDTV